jgi:translation initiation factor 2D
MAPNQAISENLSSLLSSTFPMPATTLYSNYLLLDRPAFPTRVVAPANLVSDEPTTDDPPPIETEIAIKSSSQKSLTSFLKAAEKCTP